MARYCFYCGRELSPGERCSCKEPTHAENNGGKPKDRSHTESKAGTSTASHKKARGYSSRAGKIRPRPSVFWKTFLDQLRTLFPTFSVGIRNFFQYFYRPAGKITRESLRSRKRSTIPVLVVAAFLSGAAAFLLLRAGSPLFESAVHMLLGDDITELYSHPWFALLGFILLAGLSLFILITSFYVVIRLSNRKTSYRRVADLVSISMIYLIVMEIFLIVTLLGGSRGSVSLLLISFVLMAAAHFLSFRSALALSEDMVFFVMIASYLVTYTLCRALLSITAVLFTLSL